MIEKLFNSIFTANERMKIQDRNRSEPWLTMRKAWILYAYMCDYPLRDIARSVNRNNRQARYLLEKAEDLFSVNDREIHNYIGTYERKVADASGVSAEAY